MKYTLLLMGIIGLYGFFSGLKTILRDRKRSLIPCTAAIVGMEREQDGKGFVSFTPVYEYRHAGRSYRGKHRISSSKYGKGMLGVGGMDKTVLRKDRAAVDAEIERLKPLIALGGFLPCPDHRLMPGTKFELVQYYAEEIKRIRI